MYQNREHEIKQELNNVSLIFCTQIAEKVKQPPYIPFYEAYTYDLVGRYFGLTEKRINNAYKSNRGILINDSAMVTGKEILHVADYAKSLGVSYGHLCTFSNGVVAQIAYGQNMVFNSRALLKFAVILQKESETAKAIYDILDKQVYKNCGYLRRKTPWFYANVDNSVHALDITANHPEIICPYLKQFQVDDKSRDKQSIKAQGKTSQIQNNTSNHNTRACICFDTQGRLVHRFASAAEASRTLGISKYSIYNSCAGRTKTAGGGNGKSGKYRFEYAD